MKSLIFLLKALKIALRAIGRTLFLVRFPIGGKDVLTDSWAGTIFLYFPIKSLKIALTAIGGTLFFLGFPIAGEKYLNWVTGLCNCDLVS